MRYVQTVVVPGNIVDEIEDALDKQESPTGLAESVDFDNGFSAGISVDANGIVYEVFDRDGTSVHLGASEAHSLEGEYSGPHDSDDYILVILRGAATTLTDEAQLRYSEQGANHCPMCGCEDIHASRPQINGSEVTVAVSCCNCDAEWRDSYVLASTELVAGPTQDAESVVAGEPLDLPESTDGVTEPVSPPVPTPTPVGAPANAALLDDDDVANTGTYGDDGDAVDDYVNSVLDDENEEWEDVD